MRFGSKWCKSGVSRPWLSWSSLELLAAALRQGFRTTTDREASLEWTHGSNWWELLLNTGIIWRINLLFRLIYHLEYPHMIWQTLHFHTRNDYMFYQFSPSYSTLHWLVVSFVFSTLCGWWSQLTKGGLNITFQKQHSKKHFAIFCHYFRIGFFQIPLFIGGCYVYKYISMYIYIYTCT
jgi:hypothetical protein